MKSQQTVNFFPGQIFLTTKMTLLSEPDSMLAKMFSGELPPGAKDEQGAYMVDGTPEYFKPILNYLRRRELLIDPNISKDGVLAEARFFGIQGLVDQMEKIAEDASRIALEEKEMKLLKESLISFDLLRKYKDEYNYGPLSNPGLRQKLEKRIRDAKL